MNTSKTYKVKCPTCHKTREKTTKKIVECRSCSKKRTAKEAARNRWKDIPKVEYGHFCLGCFKEWKDQRNKLVLYCGDCNRVHSKRYKWEGSYNLTVMEWAIKNFRVRYFRVCEVCGDIKQVKTKQASLAKRCRKHGVGAKKGTKQKPRKRRPKNVVSKKQIDEARKLNREHKAYVESLIETPKQKVADADMIAEWLKNNKPSIEVDDSLPLIRVDQIRRD